MVATIIRKKDKKVVSVFNHVESVHKFELLEVCAIIYKDGIDGAPEIVNVDMVQNYIALS